MHTCSPICILVFRGNVDKAYSTELVGRMPIAANPIYLRLQCKRRIPPNDTILNGEFLIFAGVLFQSGEPSVLGQLNQGSFYCLLLFQGRAAGDLCSKCSRPKSLTSERTTPRSSTTDHAHVLWTLNTTREYNSDVKNLDERDQFLHPFLPTVPRSANSIVHQAYKVYRVIQCSTVEALPW